MDMTAQVYGDVTARVCLQACIDLNSDQCCSVVFHKSTRMCQITPLEVSSAGVRNVSRPHVDYYKRKKCEGIKHSVPSFMHHHGVELPTHNIIFLSYINIVLFKMM